MAKAVKEKEVKRFQFSQIGNILDNISKTVPIHIDREIKEKKFISSGVYLLDASISGKLLGGGIQSNRIFTMGGESGSGKSFIAYSFCKNAQKQGYSIIFIDTEGSIDLEALPNFGISTDEDKFTLVRSNKVEDVNMTLTTLLDQLKKEKLAGYEIQPIMIVLDSIGQMSSIKEISDLLKLDIKADFTRSKSLGSLFRSINSDLSYLDIPMVVCNHTYETMDMFSQTKLKGGNAVYYASSTVAFMSRAKLKDEAAEDEMDLQSGIIVTLKTVKSRLAKPKKVKFEISFSSGLNAYNGLQFFCTPETFDKVGIALGKGEVNKKTGEFTFVPGGKKWYVRHLDKSFTTKQLFRSEVFNDDVMKSLEPIVNNYFRYKSLEELEETEKEFEKNFKEDDDDDNIDADNFFDEN